MPVSALVDPRLKRARLGPWPAGIDLKSAPYALGKGRCRDAQNALFDEEPGTAIKRFGNRQLSLLPSGSPARDGGVFIKSDGSAYFYASDGAKLYVTQDPSNTAGWSLLKSGLNSDGFMEFEVAEDRIWMSNGIDAVMSHDGTTLLTYDREFQSTTNLAAITTTTLDHAGLTEADDYWNGMKLVFTAGANIGVTVTVTDFDAANDRITFTPAISGGAVTDRFKVGIILPKARALRSWDGHLWLGSTTDNVSELRFNDLVDPDSGTAITIDNPRAYPAANQLDVYSTDGDRVWGLSPVLRDRIFAHKATGLFRVERDPLTVYRVELVSRLGSRFPRSWVEHNSLLYFVGQDKDGLPEVYKTDMVDVLPVDQAGGLEPVLRALQQPNALQRVLVQSAQEDFDAGEKSTLCKTSGGALEVDAWSTEAGWQGPALVSGENVDIETNPGQVNLLGEPEFEVAYEAAALPALSNPLWSRDTGTNGGFATQQEESISGGILSLTNGPTFAGGYHYYRSGVLSSSKDAFLSIRVKGNAAAGSFSFGLYNGSKGVLYRAEVGLTRFGATSASVSVSVTSYHTYKVLLKADGTFKLWIDGVLSDSGTAGSTTQNKVIFGMFGTQFGLNGTISAVSVGQSVDVDFVRYHSDFKGDRLQSFSSKISPVALPDTLPSAGTIVMQSDFTRAPDALRRVYQTATLNGGTIGLESWTASSSDFTTGIDPAGYVAVANGAVPTSLARQYQRIRATITRASVAEAPWLETLKTGMLWRSGALQIGANITAWRTFLATLTTPAGVDQTIRIRRATTTATPAESDWGAWTAITNGDNIGTILSDGTPPTTRWIDLKVEQGVSSAGLLPIVEALVEQWNEGSSAILPLHGVAHKKRYLFTAAQLTSSKNDRVLVYDRNDAPTKFVGWNLNALIHFKGRLIGFDAESDKILELDVDGLYNDKGSAIDAYVDTGEEILGREEVRKDLRFSYLHVGARLGTLKHSYKRPGLDSDFSTAKSVTLGETAADVRQTFARGVLAKRLQRRYRNDTLDQGMSVRGETLYYSERGASIA